MVGKPTIFEVPHFQEVTTGFYRSTVSTSFGRCSLVPFYPKWLFLASLFMGNHDVHTRIRHGEEVLVCLSDWSSDCTCHAEWFGGYPVLLCGHGRPVVGLRGHGAHHLRHHHGGLFHPGIFCGPAADLWIGRVGTQGKKTGHIHIRSPFNYVTMRFCQFFSSTFCSHFFQFQGIRKAQPR